MTQVVQVQERMFHVEHQKRNGNSKSRGQKREKRKNLRQIREKKKGNSEVLQSGIKFVVIIPKFIYC